MLKNISLESSPAIGIWTCIVFVIAFGCAAKCHGAVPDQAARNGKGMLILQVGSDWCVSGEAVRKVFESGTFKGQVGVKYELAIYDDMDKPDDKTKSANEELKNYVVHSKRFPAITCISPPPARFFAQIENIPQDVTPEKLGAAVLRATKNREAAEKLFRTGASLQDKKPSEAADSYGAAFDMLEGQCGELNVKALRDGHLAYAEEWNALQDLDVGDKYGWVRHFTMGYGVELVAAANKFREDNDFSGGKSYIESLRKIPQAHLSTNQMQCIDMAEYALWRKDPSHADSNCTLLEHAFSLGRDTFWGQSAMGYLILAGRKIDRKPVKRAEFLPRPAPKSGAPTRFPAAVVRRRLTDLTPKSELKESHKRDIVLSAVMRAVGQDGWEKLCARPGANAFMVAFFKDRTWLEDFVWSGPCRGEDAILALESLVFQDGGRWIKGDGPGRRFATAVALEYPDKDEEWLADYLDAYRATAAAGRLHKRALAQPVWQWRYAVHQGQPTASVDDAPRQQRFLSKFMNAPQRDYGGACWMVPYRTYNCFGESVQGPLYYESWAAAGEWPKRRYSPIVGGVCGELSKFGSACSNAHGLPSCTAGQPAHCAYTRRLADGKWEIDYSVNFPTRMHVSFWKDPIWSYVQSLEGTFEGDREKRLNADRMVELARLAEDRGAKPKEVESFYRQACRSWHSHYNAWLAYGDWVNKTGATLDTMRIWVRGCARGMKTGRQPLWDFLTPYFARVAEEKGRQALADALVEFAPLLRQDGVKIQEEADFKAVLKTWADPISDDIKLVTQVFKAMLNAQYGTHDYFTEVLGWGGDAMMSDEKGTEVFFKTLNQLVAEKSSKGVKASLDFGPLLLGASKAGNMGSFRQLAQLQNKIDPVPKSADSYPETDFGGAVLLSDGMLMTSSTSRWDVPARYARCIDSSPKDANAFHTEKESSPWAIVVLPGPADVCGVVVENNVTGGHGPRQTPLEVQVSENGDSWQTVFTEEESSETYRVDLRKSHPRARQVRVCRTPNAKDEVFHLSKILVYGRKLY